jgi:predicted DNA-binding transcriptional regulator AlpA
LLGVSLDTLDRMESRGEAPPRLRISPRRWGYPVGGIKRWQAAKVEATRSVLAQDEVAS